MGKLIVFSVLAWWTFTACTGPDTRSLESFKAAAQTNQWTPERSGPDPIGQADEELAEAMSDWIDDFPSTFDFEGSYSGSGDWSVEDIQSLAVSYPVVDSVVPNALKQTITHLDAAEAAFAERQYPRAQSQLDKAASALAPLRTAVPADWLAVERQTGLRLTPDGYLYPEGSETQAKVEEWVDGDTVVTDQGRVRLIGIDAPEMSDQCSLAEDAKEYAEFLAPVGSEVTLVAPYEVADQDMYGRLLRFVDLELEGTDVGYSLLDSNLAKARYDSRDGYQWHPRERAYRDAGAVPDRKALCGWEDPAILVLVKDMTDDKNEQDRARLRKEVAAALGTTARLSRTVASAKKYYAEQDRWEADLKKYEGSEGGSGGSFNVPGWACPTRWC